MTGFTFGLPADPGDLQGDESPAVARVRDAVPGDS